MPTLPRVAVPAIKLLGSFTVTRARVSWARSPPLAPGGEETECPRGSRNRRGQISRRVACVSSSSKRRWKPRVFLTYCAARAFSSLQTLTLTARSSSYLCRSPQYAMGTPLRVPLSLSRCTISLCLACEHARISAPAARSLSIDSVQQPSARASFRSQADRESEGQREKNSLSVPLSLSVTPRSRSN